MVSTLMKSTLREIRHSLGRYLAILAIVALGVGFFAGLRMSQPSMLATGVKYLNTYRFHDFRLMSTLGFTEEDVEAFAGVEGIEAARGSIYTEFLRQKEGEVTVLIAHSLTPGINDPEVLAGRLPEKARECVGDAAYFSVEDIGRTVCISPANDEDTLDLFAHDEYTLVGLVSSPLYLNYDRGTASIGSGSIAAFVLMPEDAFDTDAYYEIYLRMADGADPYSEAYRQQADGMKPRLEALLEERADLRYETLHGDAVEELRDGEQELADGWEEYRTERADAEQELADAYRDLTDGEKELADGWADYEQGKIDYADGVKKYEDGLKELADGKAELEDAKKELEEGRAELLDAEQELADGKAELEEGRAELADAEVELRGARKALNNARDQLEEGEAALDQLDALYRSAEQMARMTGMSSPAQLIALLNSGMSPELNAGIDQALQAQGSSLQMFLGGWAAAEQSIGQPLTREYIDGAYAEIEYGWKQYDDGLGEYQDGRRKYEEGLAELEQAELDIAEAEQKIADGWAEIADGERNIADAEAEIADAEIELADAEQELADAKKELDKAPRELADARRELDDGWQEYRDGLAEAEAEFADAEQELADAEQEIADGWAELEDLKEADTYTLTRSENVGYASFDNDISIIAAVSMAFPVFFFLVAALVCMTTMKRMVDEQRTQIGVLKAIGYSRGRIIGKYLFYSGSAATIGAVVGYAAGSRGLPLIIWSIYGMMYDFAPLEFVFDPVLAAVSFGAALLCSVGATWLSCRVELQNPAAQLIRPKTPKAGKRIFLERITPLWKRMSFLRKVSARNMFRYKSRLVMIVLGIGGCTALLVVGFGIRDSVGNLAEDQYNKITLYDYEVTFQDPQTAQQTAEFLAQRGWEENAGLLVHSGSIDVVFGEHSETVYQIISAENRLDGFIDLHDENGPIAYPKAGEVVLNFGLAEDMGVSVGDTVRLRDKKSGTVEVTVSAICENYIFNYVFVAPETYEEQLGEVPAFKSLLVQARPGADPYQENVYLAEGDGVNNVTVCAASRDRVTTMMSRLDIVVVVVVLFAAALAFVVLYNLTNINITERIREIATVKVLGFYQNEVAAYVFREIVTLSAIGGVVGLGMGKALHAFVMLQVQVDGMFFPNRIEPLSYLISLVLTLIFSFVISCCMRPRLKKIDMAESLKSIE